MVIPPPNVTGSLHMGHALGRGIEDIFTRWRRMAGYNAMWLPGTDHAGIATQLVVERNLRGDRGQDPPRPRPRGLRRAGLEVAGAIRQPDPQAAAGDGLLARLGPDRLHHGSRLLPGGHRGVRAALPGGAALPGEPPHQLVHLLPDGPVRPRGRIRRARRRASCTSSPTRWPTARASWWWRPPAPRRCWATPPSPCIPTIPATRPSIGKKVKHPFVDREIPIIADDVLVDPKFGTGAVKVTPAHDPNDFECGQRHGLPVGLDPGREGERSPPRAGPSPAWIGPPPAGRSRPASRQLGLERGSKPHLHSVGHCQRCDTVVEPLVSTQWFVKMAPLAEPAIEAVEQGKTRFVPESWTKTYFHWMRNIRDWCVSRQLWWGHRIPAWYCAALRRGQRGPAGARRLRSAAAAAICARTRTCSTPGSRPGCGPSPPWAGRTRPAS